MTTTRSNETVAQLGAAVYAGMQAHEMMGSILDTIESRPEEPTEAQLQVLLNMLHEGISQARHRLHAFSLERGTFLNKVVADALETTETDQDIFFQALNMYLERGVGAMAAIKQAAIDLIYIGELVPDDFPCIDFNECNVPAEDLRAFDTDVKDVTERMCAKCQHHRRGIAA